MLRTVPAGAAALAALAAPALALAETIHVAPCGDDAWSGASAVCAAPDGPKATIEAALDALTADGDEIVLHDGTYTGPGNVDLTIIGPTTPDFVLRSANGPGVTIIDGGGASRMLDFVLEVSSATRVEGITFRNGSAANGGAVRCRSNADPRFIDCRFDTCHAAGGGTPGDGGGAVKCTTNSDPRFESCTFVSCRSFISHGGAVFLDTNCDAVFEDCHFEGNLALAIDSAGGAVAALNGSDTTFDGCTFVGNESEIGGAIASIDTDLVEIIDCAFDANVAEVGSACGLITNGRVERCTFTNQEPNATFSAGALIVGGGMSPTIADCTFQGNRAAFGPGVAVTDPGSAPTIVGCRFVDNESVDLGEGAGGGAVAVANDATPLIVSCTFSKNRSDGAGGAVASVLAGHPTIAGCVLSGNAAPLGPELAVARIEAGDPASSMTVRYSLVAGGESAVWVDGGKDGGMLHWEIGNINANPCFRDPANGDFALAAGSPAIDAGDNTALPGDVVVDLAGAPRFHDDPGTADTGEGGDSAIVDMGAYEFQGTTVSCPDVNGDGTVNLPDLVAVLAAYGTCGGCPADVDASGAVDFDDVCTVLAGWGSCE